MPQEPQAPYISTVEAAKRHHLTHDHVGLLCRKAKVEGMLLGRQWYVNEHSLAEYLKRVEDEKQARRHTLSKQWRTAWTAAFVGFSLFSFSVHYAVAAFDTKGSAPVHITYAKDFVEEKEVTAPIESISHMLVAAAVVVDAYIQTIPVPDLKLAEENHRPWRDPAVSGDIFAGMVAANETLTTLNDNMFALYARAATQLAGLAAFDAAQAGHTWSKTFGAFGERFVADLWSLNDAQVAFYFAAADSLERGYNTLADALESTPTLDSSISVASVGYVPSFEGGENFIGGLWNGAVDFVANIFIASDNTVAEKFALQDIQTDTPAQILPQSSSGLAARPQSASGQGDARTFALGSAPTLKSVQELLPAQPAFFAGNYVDQTSLNLQIDAWMMVVRELIANGGSTGYVSNPATAALGNSSGGTVINNYSILQRIDKLDGVTITNSSINGVSDLSNIGATDGIGTWFTPSSIGNSTSTLLHLTAGFISLASSTITNLSVVNSTTTNATSTNHYASSLIAGNATSTTFAITGVTSSLLKTLSSGAVVPAVAGTDYLTSATTFAFPYTASTNFGAAANATSTLIGFTAGLYATASSTIGGGTQTSGLTISGGATTTGNAYFAGNVGVGIMNPSGSKFYVSDNTSGGYALRFDQNHASGNGFYSYLNSNSTNEAFRIDNSGGAIVDILTNGNVGLGTTSPYAKLSVGGDIVGTNLTATGTLTVAGNTSLQAATSTTFAIAGVTSSLLKTLSSGAVVAATAGVDYALGNVAFPFTPSTFGTSASNATSTLIGFTNGIYATASSTIGGGTQTSGLTILGGATTTGNAYFAGNVGIGIAAPNDPLSVAKTGTDYGTLVTSGEGSFRVVSHFLDSTAGYGVVLGYSGTGQNAVISSYKTNSDLIFSLYNGTMNEWMRIKNNGNVGIGTSTATGKLTISGIQANSNTGSIVQIQDTTAGAVGTGAGVALMGDDTTGTQRTFAIVQGYKAYAGSGFDGNLGLFTRRNGQGTLDERLTITGANGNVGIGTTTPDTLLTLNTAGNANQLAFNKAGVNQGYIAADTTGLYFTSGTTNQILRFYRNNGASETMRIDASGNVGIGTTTMDSSSGCNGKLCVSGGVINLDNSQALAWGGGTGRTSINGSTAAGTMAFALPSASASTNVYSFSNGNVGIGTTSPTSALTVNGRGYVSTGLDVGTNANFGESAKMHIYFAGAGAEYGISMQLAADNGRFMQFHNAAGGAVGSITETSTATAYNTSSDRRVKENIDYTKLGLDTLMQLPVREFSFIKDEAHATTTGFVAQELYEVFPWAVSTNGDNGIDPLTGSSTPWSVDYGRITPLIVKAIQDLNINLLTLSSTTASTTPSSVSFADSFFANVFNRIITWLADAANGITKIFAKEVQTDKLCVGSTCVTEEQFMAMVAVTAQGGVPPTAVTPGQQSSASTSSSSPTLALNGNNPQAWQFDTLWQDNLGALFTNSGGSETIYATSTVDATVAGTTTIDYWAQVPGTGAWLHATRQVVVVAPAATSSPRTVFNEDAVLDSLASTTEN